MEQQWLQYGLPGLIVVSFGIVFRMVWAHHLKTLKEHREERDEWRRFLINLMAENKKDGEQWRAMIEKQFDEVEKRDRESKDLLYDMKRLLKPPNKRNS